MYRFMYHNEYKTLVELDLVPKSAQKAYRTAKPANKAQMMHKTLIGFVKEHPRFHELCVKQGRLAVIKAEHTWLNKPAVLHIDDEVVNDLREMGWKYLKNAPSIDALLRITDLDPLMLITYQNGKPKPTSLLMATYISGRSTDGQPQPLFVVNESGSAASDYTCDDWLLYDPKDTLEQMNLMSVLLESRTHLGSPLIRQETADDVPRPRREGSLAFNMAAFRVGLEIYTGNFPDAIREGLPSDIKGKAPKYEVKPRIRTFTYNTEHTPDVGTGSTHIRRPHWRILQDDRYTRNADGTPKIIPIPAMQVTRGIKPKTETLEKKP